MQNGESKTLYTIDELGAGTVIQNLENRYLYLKETEEDATDLLDQMDDPTEGASLYKVEITKLRDIPGIPATNIGDEDEDLDTEDLDSEDESEA